MSLLSLNPPHVTEYLWDGLIEDKGIVQLIGDGGVGKGQTQVALAVHLALELPFGPFLAMGALVYLFVHPWLELSFGLLWGTNGGLM